MVKIFIFTTAMLLFIINILYHNYEYNIYIYIYLFIINNYLKHTVHTLTRTLGYGVYMHFTHTTKH